MFPLLAALGLAGAQSLSIPHEHYELDNGLDVTLVEDHSTPIVHVNVWYHVGSRNEAPGLTGFAHLFEHLMFQGSVSQPDEYFDPLNKVGADLNGSTTTDRTNYYQTVPAEYLPLALFLESDRMGWLLPVLDQGKLDNQREVVRNERRQNYESQPFGSAYMHLSEALWPVGHPYHHTPIGSHEDLQNAKLEDVKAFFQRYYVPNNASLVISGDFDAKVAKDLVQKYFAGIPRGEDVPGPTPVPAPRTASTEIRRFEDVPEQRVWIAWPSPALYEEGDADLDLLNAPLSQGKDSRLYKALVAPGIAKSVGAYQSSSLLASSYIVIATAAPGHDTDEIVRIVDQVLADITGPNPVTADDIETARANYEAGYYGSIATIEGKAELLQGYLLGRGDPDWIASDLARYARTPEQVTASARALFATPRVVMHIGPPPPSETPPDTPAAEAVGFWKKLFGRKKAPTESTAEPAPEPTQTEGA